jgi:hypothetical protein
MDREFLRDRNEGAGSRYPRDEPFQFGDTHRGQQGDYSRETGRQYGGYDSPPWGGGGASGSRYGADSRYGDRLQSVQGGNFGRGEPYADEGRYGGSRHEGYGLTGQRYGHEEAFSSPGGPETNWEGRGRSQGGWPDTRIRREGEQGYGGGRSAQRTMPKGYKRSDARLHEDICERLSRSGLDVSEVSVSVSDGQVTLEGAVAERYVKHAIEDIADDCMGVEGVDNRIRVQRPGSPAGASTAGSSSPLSGQAPAPSAEGSGEAGASGTGLKQAGKSASGQMQEGAGEQPSRTARKSSAQGKRK